MNQFIKEELHSAAKTFIAEFGFYALTTGAAFVQTGDYSQTALAAIGMVLFRAFTKIGYEIVLKTISHVKNVYSELN